MTVEKVLTSAVGLRKIKDQFWGTDDSGSAYYPTGFHARLADAEDTSFWFGHRNEIIGLMVSRFPPAGPIVDIGGGNGFVARGLKQRGIASIVLEPDEIGASIAHQRGVPVIRAAFSRDLFRECSLDAVGLFDVLEHIPDDVAFLSDCRYTLRPGSLMYLTVPASPSLWSSDDDFAKHCRRYTHRSLAELLHQAGFEPVVLTYFFSLLVVPLYLFRTLASQLGLRRVTTADDAVAHHAGKSGISGLASTCLSFEVSVLKAGMRLPFGTSLIAVARKPPA
jgi:SAM-dependent methyltransferase